MMKIDSHQHFWLYHPDTHEWITEDMNVIRKNFLPNDISYSLKKQGIDGAVAVQASQTLAENDFLLELASAYALIKGVVGWVDFEDSNLEQQLKQYKEIPLMKGFRHIIEGESDPDFLIRDFFLKAMELLTQYGFTYDLLVKPIHFESTLSCVRQNPNLKFVLDHIAKPDLKEKKIEEWKPFIQELSRFPNVHCKISGLVTEAEWHQWEPNDFEDCMSFALDSFGVDRLMYGSDWPVCLLSSSYEDWTGLCKTFTKQWSEQDQAKFWGGNAVKFYNLK